ncbi:hypothetical protein EN823_07530 [bacterium M00.F.Ca.ET.180.01.1.1]|nr:hypothetical protein EN872_07535 [bacterium M00.F.Ca.ET.229.01.1.1]TGS38929.1 hypothetical protein EN823_07530 [bacterium M00.F.Ca.ET.180.01.1.1]TLW36602.1 hypothetical protein FFX88_06710 [Staphylococcus cohnii]
MDWSSLYLIYYDFDRACLPGDMARACSLSLISFPRASARCKIVWNIYQITKAKAHFKQFIPSNILTKFLFCKINNMN